MSDTERILALLNAYEQGHASDEGANIWPDLIYGLPGYDPAATDEIDRGRSDRFIADGVEYVYVGQASEWQIQR